MADDDDVAPTTAMAITFRFHHLVRLRGFNHNALDGKLVRIETHMNEATGKFGVVLTASSSKSSRAKSYTPCRLT